jgi:hypothetical protein
MKMAIRHELLVTTPTTAEVIPIAIGTLTTAEGKRKKSEIENPKSEIKKSIPVAA